MMNEMCGLFRVVQEEDKKTKYIIIRFFFTLSPDASPMRLKRPVHDESLFRTLSRLVSQKRDKKTESQTLSRDDLSHIFPFLKTPHKKHVSLVIVMHSASRSSAHAARGCAKPLVASALHDPRGVGLEQRAQSLQALQSLLCGFSLRL